jgi:hypothetical protein
MHWHQDFAAVSVLLWWSNWYFKFTVQTVRQTVSTQLLLVVLYLPCGLVEVNTLTYILQYRTASTLTHNGRTSFLQNVITFLPKYTAPSPLWTLHILFMTYNLNFSDEIVVWRLAAWVLYEMCVCVCVESSRMLCFVIGYAASDILKERIVFIFRVKHSLGMLDPEHEGRLTLQDIRISSSHQHSVTSEETWIFYFCVAHIFLSLPHETQYTICSN